jgi:periplasmic protein TonB
MKSFAAIISTLVLTASIFAQSGRRARAAATPLPSPEEKPLETAKTSQAPATPPVTAEKNQDYRCTTDGTLAHILDSEEESSKGFLPKEVDTRAELTAKPDPKYTEQARAAGVQGLVTLKVLLSANGKIDRLRVVRRLPYGLTESSIRAACEIKFKPAIKGNQPVAQWLNVEYVFRLAKSSIFGP